MELKHFRLIKTIAEEGSIANSSDKLFLTQSALSHQLRELEERLGFKVFHRSRNRWLLTEQGNELYRLAIDVLETIDQGFKSIENINEGSMGAVRISTECYSFYSGLPGFIQRMAILYPNIDVSLVEDATYQPISKLLGGDIDMAIVSSSPATSSLNAVTLFEDEIFAVMHKENALAEKEYLQASDFTDTHLIIHSFPLESVFVYEQFLKPNQVMPVKISALPMTEVALEMVQANMGLMCMPKRYLEAFRGVKNLVLKPIGPHGLKRTQYLVSRSADQSKKYIHDFVAMIQEEFERRSSAI
ncbi:MAG: LysR family transcriptional regulator [Roseivirga sp.]|nr:LysR family transcriptional regulator [Roseivirga sp.]